MMQYCALDIEDVFIGANLFSTCWAQDHVKVSGYELVTLEMIRAGCLERRYIYTYSQLWAPVPQPTLEAASTIVRNHERNALTRTKGHTSRQAWNLKSNSGTGLIQPPRCV